MKKAILLILMGLISISMFQQQILAESWDYLPGGDNYLNADNFVIDSGYIVTEHPFIFIPNQDYIFTVHDDYYHLFGPHEILIEISFYDNDDLITTQEIIYQDFEFNTDNTTLSFQLHSPLNANKLGLRILDLDPYYSEFGFSQMILEEGTTFDGFEDFIYGTIVDTTSPEFLNVNTVYSYVQSPITVSEIQASLSAIDAIDGDVSSRISILSDDYSANMDTLGTYSIIFEVTDLSGNAGQAEINVEVIDVLKPEFSEMDPILVPYGNVYSVPDILALLHASDNYDGDISGLITLVEDNYSSSNMIVGDYTMTFSVSDSSGNVALQTIDICVVDEEAPIITGETSIVVGYDETITIAEILMNFTATDNYDSSLEFITESDNYTANRYIIGSYQIEFSVTDSSLNTSYVIVNIEVVDEIGPILYFDSSIIQTYADTVLALEDFLHLLTITKEISTLDSLSVKVLYDSYTSHASVPGVYHLKLLIGYSEDDTFEKDFQIIVKDITDHIYDPDLEEISFLEKYRNYILFGALGFVTITTNVVWFVILKRR